MSIKSKGGEKTLKAWALIKNNKIMKCHCHPSKKTSYVIYARKFNEFDDIHWRQCEIKLINK